MEAETIGWEWEAEEGSELNAWEVAADDWEGMVVIEEWGGRLSWECFEEDELDDIKAT